MESKRDIRKRILFERTHMSYEEWERKSDIICNKIVKHPLFSEADSIYCYVDYNGEVKTRSMIEKAWDLKKKVAVPKVEGDVMHFYHIENFSDLEEGYRGILEPKTDFPAQDNHALVIMPGVAFDRNRNRVGYGKGFYDKFLKGHNGPAIAIAFELQIVNQIPANSHDFCPEILITEEKMYE